MPVLKVDEPVYRVLRAQAENIARIDEGFELPNTDEHGNTIELWGPEVDIIRLYDTPHRFLPASDVDNWKSMAMLMPVSADATSQIASREDRNITYSVALAVRLLGSEVEAQRKQQMNDSRMFDDNPLAIRAHRLLFDFDHVWRDNFHLITDDCPAGLVDHQTYNVNWDPGVEHPAALFIVTINAIMRGY